jgi:hypothetical protein
MIQISSHVPAQLADRSGVMTPEHRLRRTPRHDRFFDIDSQKTGLSGRFIARACLIKRIAHV